MMTKVRSLVALYYMLTLSGIFGESFRERFFQTTKLRRLTGHLIIRVTTASQLLCVHKCLANTDCRSCNFGVSRKKHNVCELNSLDIAPSAMDKENVFFDKDFVFISMKNTSPVLADKPEPDMRRPTVNPASACTGLLGHFEQFQSIPTAGALAVTTFEMSRELFIVFASSDDDDSGVKTKSPIYRLRGNSFVLNQTLSTFAAFDAEHFSIDEEHYLMVTNSDNGSTTTIDSVVHKWVGGQFVEFQYIRTDCASDTHFFTIGDRKFLAVCNFYGGKSFIYEWIGGSFIKVQDIPTFYPRGLTSLVVNNDTYIIVGSYTSSDKTVVFKWMGSRFEWFQLLASTNAVQIHSFETSESTFIAVANYQSAEGLDDTDSFIYRWNGSSFTHYQSLQTHAAHSWRSFCVGGVTYLVVANYYGASEGYNVKSEVYKLKNKRFERYQGLDTTGASGLSVITHSGQRYLAVSQYRDQYDQFNIDSRVYIWKQENGAKQSYHPTK